MVFCQFVALVTTTRSIDVNSLEALLTQRAFGLVTDTAALIGEEGDDAFDWIHVHIYNSSIVDYCTAVNIFAIMQVVTSNCEKVEDQHGTTPEE